MDLHEAKKLFFAFDGSFFFMDRQLSRDQMELFKACVNSETEAAWLEELTQIKLRGLHERGNFRVVSFLRHHADYRHLDKMVHVEPLGSFEERCAFLELLLRYAEGCENSGCDPSSVARVVPKVVMEAERILKRVRSAKSIQRVREILTAARDWKRS